MAKGCFCDHDQIKGNSLLHDDNDYINGTDTDLIDDDLIIPQKIFNYFGLPETVVLMEEFMYIMDGLKRIYKNSFGVGFRRDQFCIKMSPTEFVDLLSDDENNVKETVEYIKSRPEMDVFLTTYGFDFSIKSELKKMPLHIGFLMSNFKISRFLESKFGDMRTNYVKLLVNYRMNKKRKLFDLMPNFDFDDLYHLIQQIEYSRTKQREFWIEYEEFWKMFDYDEIFSPWEYARAYGEIFNNGLIIAQNVIILLRFSQTDMSSSYHGIDAIYYYLYAIHYCLILNPKSKMISRMIEGLVMFKQRNEVTAFLKVHSNGNEKPKSEQKSAKSNDVNNPL